MGFFDTLFGGGAEKNAAQENIKALQLYQGQSLGALKDAYGQATGYGQQAVGAFDPLVALGKQYAPATQLQLDAIGAGGAGGTARASEALAATPGFDLAQQAIERRRALGGNWDSGGTDTDLAKYISSVAYPSWMQNVNTAAGMGGQYTTAGAQGQAGGYTNLGNLASQYGQNQTGVYGNVASGTMDANKFAAAGEAAGAKNLLGAGLSLASLAMAPMTGGASLAGMGWQGVKNLFAPGPQTAGAWNSPYYGPAQA
jgi:hypothetical protein